MQKITTFLWFDDVAEEAANYYVSIFPDARIVDVNRKPSTEPGADDSVLTVTFELAGQRFMALNGGPQFTFTEAISLLVDCVDQAEVDELWGKLTADGGQEGPCGWLKDRYGVSWQIVPARLTELTTHADPVIAEKAMQAMFGMKKIDIQGLEDAIRA